MAYPEQHPQNPSIDEMIERKLTREEPVSRITRTFLGKAAAEGALVVRPGEYREMRALAREIAEESA